MKQTLQHISTRIAEMKNQYQNEGFEIIGIFGSYARGSAHKYSDVDIAYKLDYTLFDTKFKGGFAKILRIEQIKEELQKHLHLKVDLVSLHNNSPFKEKIAQDLIYV